MATESLACPFCDFSNTDSYILILHVEEVHTEDSPFNVTDTSAPSQLPPRQEYPTSSTTDAAADASSQKFMQCPEAECGEAILLDELNEHLDLHMAERLTLDGFAASSLRMKRGSDQHSYSFIEHSFSTDLPEALRQSKKSKRSRSPSEKSSLGRSIFNLGSSSSYKDKEKPKHVKYIKTGGRLGRDELGPYAWEEQMPKWLYEQLERGGKVSVVNRISHDGRIIKQETIENETAGIMPVLAQLCALDKSVREVYLCHPSVQHVGKTPREGGFCGYRNIQMLISYIQGAKAQGHHIFPGRIPGVLRLQDWIEDAWKKGINSAARVQTGGIKGTRKYIGTPEAQAIFVSFGIDCDVASFSDGSNGVQAHEKLLDAVEKYFQSAVKDEGSKVHKTLLPPIYLQQSGHSITIVGLERRRDGSRNLLVFDPSFKPSVALSRLLGRRDIKSVRPEVLDAYRRVDRQLKRHREFEALKLTACPPSFRAWDI